MKIIYVKIKNLYKYNLKIIKKKNFFFFKVLKAKDYQTPLLNIKKERYV
jgi:hypothetical protein